MADPIYLNRDKTKIVSVSGRKKRDLFTKGIMGKRGGGWGEGRGRAANKLVSEFARGIWRCLRVSSEEETEKEGLGELPKRIGDRAYWRTTTAEHKRRQKPRGGKSREEETPTSKEGPTESTLKRSESKVREEKKNQSFEGRWGDGE